MRLSKVVKFLRELEIVGDDGQPTARRLDAAEFLLANRAEFERPERGEPRPQSGQEEPMETMKQKQATEPGPTAAQPREVR